MSGVNSQLNKRDDSDPQPPANDERSQTRERKQPRVIESVVSLSKKKHREGDIMSILSHRTIKEKKDYRMTSRVQFEVTRYSEDMGSTNKWLDLKDIDTKGSAFKKYCMYLGSHVTPWLFKHHCVVPNISKQLPYVTSYNFIFEAVKQSDLVSKLLVLDEVLVQIVSYFSVDWVLVEDCSEKEGGGPMPTFSKLLLPLAPSEDKDSAILGSAAGFFNCRKNVPGEGVIGASKSGSHVAANGDLLVSMSYTRQVGGRTIYYDYILHSPMSLDLTACQTHDSVRSIQYELVKTVPIFTIRSVDRRDVRIDCLPFGDLDEVYGIEKHFDTVGVKVSRQHFCKYNVDTQGFEPLKGYFETLLNEYFAKQKLSLRVLVQYFRHTNCLSFLSRYNGFITVPGPLLSVLFVNQKKIDLVDLDGDNHLITEIDLSAALKNECVSGYFIDTTKEEIVLAVTNSLRSTNKRNGEVIILDKNLQVIRRKKLVYNEAINSLNTSPFSHRRRGRNNQVADELHPVMLHIQRCDDYYLLMTAQGLYKQYSFLLNRQTLSVEECLAIGFNPVRPVKLERLQPGCKPLLLW